MSRYNTDNRNSLLSLLHDYIDVYRRVQREQNNALITYLNAQREMSSSLNELILRYLEIERSTRNLNNTFSIPPPPPPPLFSFNSNNNRAPSQSPINNNPLNNNPLNNNPLNNTPFSFNWPSNSTSTSNTNPIPRTEQSLRSLNSITPRDTPISSFTNRRIPLRRRHPRRGPRIRATTNVTTTTIPRDVFQNFINNTLNMGNVPQPLNAADISANITNLTYGEIAETTNQTICPFTQENFINSDEVSRINPCGHIFTRSHLNRYLTNFDYRCPVCRRNLRQVNDVENPPTEPTNNLLDLSSNLTILPMTQNTQQTRNIINNAVESVTNALMSNITNQITNDPSRNAFVAEYSFLLPQLNTSTTNVTPNLASNFTSTADMDMQDYLGMPPRNSATQTALPPLPEESGSETAEFEDDDL